MAASRKFFRFPALALCLVTSVAFAAGKPRSTSASRQFIVYGPDVAVRGALCDLAERTKSNLLRLLEQRDNWKTVLVINLDFPRANLPDAPPPQLVVSQLGYGLKLQLNLLATRKMREESVQRELLRAILIEIMYRGRGDIASGTPYVTPPDWLLDGILALQPGRDAKATAELLRSVVAARKIAPLENVVREKRAQLDAPSRLLHDAYSRALLQMLLDAPGGHAKLARLVVDLPVAPNDALADLRSHFPETLGQRSGKWWVLSVAQLSATDRHEPFTAAETAAQLDRILHFSIPGADGSSKEYSLGEFMKFRKVRSARPVLAQVGQRLFLLSARAHPSYRPIVRELYELSELLARGKARRIGERLGRVASYRAVIETQSREIDDYLNWYEATQSKAMSGAFSQLLDPAKEEQPLPRRRDPISVYLDSVEMETN